MVSGDAAVKPVLVIKVGGSLLDLPDLKHRLEDLLMLVGQRERVLLLIGGGGAAELVRGWDRLHGLSDEAAHQLAIAAMSVNALLVSELLPRTAIAGSMVEAELAWNEGAAAIIHPERWLARYEADAAAGLAHDWSVTSDSIAAWIALQQGAGLLLVKSIDPPVAGLHEAAVMGVVDAAFPTLAAELPYIDWVNLRVDSPVRRRWRPAGR